MDEAVAEMIGVGRETQRQFDAVKKLAEINDDSKGFLSAMLNDEMSVKAAYTASKESVTDVLERAAQAEAPPTLDQQRKACIAAVRKARDLVIQHDAGLLADVLCEELDELFDWVSVAYDASN